MEVYPHAAHIRLFNLRERIPYKTKKGRPVAFRREQLREYQNHLKGLLAKRWPEFLGLAEVGALLHPDSTEVRGKALKAVEDVLDAVTCAYVAFHAHRNGEKRMEIIGDYRTGAVAVPR